MNAVDSKIRDGWISGRFSQREYGAADRRKFAGPAEDIDIDNADRAPNSPRQSFRLERQQSRSEEVDFEVDRWDTDTNGRMNGGVCGKIDQGRNDAAMGGFSVLVAQEFTPERQMDCHFTALGAKANNFAAEPLM